MANLAETSTGQAFISADGKAWQSIRVTGEGMVDNETFVPSAEISKNPASTGSYYTGSSPSGNIDQELSYGTETDTLLATVLRGAWDGDTLKGGRLFTKLQVRKSFDNPVERFTYDFVNARISETSFTIPLSDGAILTASHTLLANSVKSHTEWYVFNDNTVPTAAVAKVDSIWINNSDGKVYQCAADKSFPATETSIMTAGATWTVGDNTPTGGADGDWHIWGATGEFWRNTGSTWAIAFTIPDMAGNITSGTIEPTGAPTDYMFYLKTDTGDFYQSSARKWVKLANFKLTDVTGFYYQGNTFTAANTAPLMTSPYFRSISIAGLVKPICLTDASFSITNEINEQKGSCSDNTTFPNTGNVDVTFGGRKVSGTMGLFFTSMELANKLKISETVDFSFEITDGTNGYEVRIPQLKFTGGGIPVFAENGQAVKWAPTWEAEYNAALQTDIIIKQITV